MQSCWSAWNAEDLKSLIERLTTVLTIDAYVPNNPYLQQAQQTRQNIIPYANILTFVIMALIFLFYVICLCICVCLYYGSMNIVLEKCCAHKSIIAWFCNKHELLNAKWLLKLLGVIYISIEKQ